ncbi:MAG: hypothetical protein LBD10_12165 [Desulfobulbus sp.]|jgi:hypothetical protein|uniref:hypothetical protein n=1 Tax=Desulfobulbus sp. TaxID=895 RepID=UPI00284EAD45|nr:hypothetical protein [Desulfobulbus sp.]MDR2550943.1 hypothetical protein [Desulfobulbus sp.]
MNNIQEKDWAEESWHGHTGMNSANDYCIAPLETEPGPDDASEPEPGDDSGK